MSGQYAGNSCLETNNLNVKDKILARSIPEPNSGCWLWLGVIGKHKVSGGYGLINHRGKKVRAHRLSYEVFVGKIPSGTELDHLCRMKCCVNPEHLEPVPHLENMRRWNKYRVKKTHCINGHEFSAENTQLRPDGRGRVCRICANARAHAQRVRAKAMKG